MISIRVMVSVVALLHGLASGALALEQPVVSAPVLPDGTPANMALDGEGNQLLANHDGTFENAYGWLAAGVGSPDVGAFAERFQGAFQLGSLQFHLTQIGNQDDALLDVFIWRDDGTLRPGPLHYSLTGIDPGPIATWPAVTRVDVPVDVIVYGKWWVGCWGTWPGEDPEWLVAADEGGPGGAPATKVASGLGYPAGWHHPNVVSSWSECRSLGIQVAGAVAVSTPEGGAPRPFALGAPRPNPFRSIMRLGFELDAPAPAQVAVFDASGRRVRLVAEGVLPVGHHEIVWDGRTGDGLRAAPGVYVIRLDAGERSAARKVVVAR